MYNYAELSRILTGNKDQIRPTYKGKKYKKQVQELKDFEKEFRAKYKKYVV